MNSRLHPYINFDGNAREALEFYNTVFGGGKLEMVAFREGGVPHEEQDADKLMHGWFEAENGIAFMASDAMKAVTPDTVSNIQLSLSGDNAPELTAYFEMLAEEGTVLEPLTRAPWGDTFGMCKDRFGITWMVNITE